MSNKPSHIVYHVKESNQLDDAGNHKGIWTRIGAVWTTKNGHLSGHLDLIPTGPAKFIIKVNDD